jgi:HSP20 family protein
MTLIPFRRTADLPERRRETPFHALQKEMNHLINGFFSDFEGLEGTSLQAVSARVDVAEDEKEYRINIEIPGMEEKDIELTVEDNCLIVQGEKRQSKEQKDENWVRMESSYGNFYRSIPLRTEIDEDRVDAKYKNGVLKIKAPKSPHAATKKKRIQIKA